MARLIPIGDFWGTAFKEAVFVFCLILSVCISSVGISGGGDAQGAVSSGILSVGGFRWDTLKDPAPEVPDEFRRKEPSSGELSEYVVQFDGPILPEWRASLERAGAVIKDYIPFYAYHVAATPEALAAIRKLPEVRFTMLWHYWFNLAGALREVLRQGCPAGELGVSVLLKDAVDRDAMMKKLEGASLDVRMLGDTGSVLPSRVLNFSLGGSSLPVVLAELARDPRVEYVEPYRGRVLNLNIARGVCTGNDRSMTPLYDYGLTGAGQVVQIQDTGIDCDHDAFRDDNYASIADGIDFKWDGAVNMDHRKIVRYSAASGDMDGHGTADAAIIAGNDLDDPKYRGIAYDAKLAFTGMAVDAEYFDQGLGADARICSSSWGDEAPPDSPSYDSSCRIIDQYVWDNKKFLMLFSAGNSDGKLNTTAAAKSEVTVTACGTGEDSPGLSGNQDMWSACGDGPTLDGRLGVTLAAPGSRILAPDTDASGDTDNTNLAAWSGTSQACAAAAGTAALIRQYFEDGWYPTGNKIPSDSISPSAALVRAMLIASAVDFFGGGGVTNHAPDSIQGWGRVYAGNALHFFNDSTALKVVDRADGLSTGETETVEFEVPHDVSELRFVLVWSDFPAAPGADPALVNNLDLEVTTPTSKVFKGNVFDSGWSAPGGSSDALETEEMVKLPEPVPGTYSVKIVARNVPQASQDYALVMLGVGNRAPHAVISGPASVNIGFEARFSASGSYDPDGDILSCLWRLDGAEVSRDQEFSAAFDTAGIHEVSLEVVDSKGNRSIEKRMDVYVGRPALWRPDEQSGGRGVWREATSSCHTARALISGSSLHGGTSSLRLVLKGNPFGSYKVRGVSLVRREAGGLDGVDGTFAKVTFGQAGWGEDVPVPVTGLMSNPVDFPLLDGQDVFVTFFATAPYYFIDDSLESSRIWIREGDFTGEIDWQGKPIDSALNAVCGIARIVAGLNIPINAPSTLKAENISGDILLSWTDNSINEDGFVVERSADGASFSEIARLRSDSRSYTDCGRTGGFWYRVKAFNEDGESDYATVRSGYSSVTLDPGCEEPGPGDSGSAPAGTLSTKWASQGCMVTRTSDCSHGGAYSYMVTGASDQDDYCYQDVTERLAFFSRIRRSTSFEYSAWVKHSDIGTHTFRARMNYRFNGTGSGSKGTERTLDLSKLVTTVPNDGEWHEVGGTFTVDWTNGGADADYVTGLRYARVYLVRLEGTSGQAYHFDDFVLREVSHEEDSLPPVADAAVLPGGGGNRVVLDASRSHDPDGEIVEYLWDADGDGTFEVFGPDKVRVERSMRESGVYRARLRVVDDDGRQADKEFSLVVPFIPRPQGASGHAKIAARIIGTGFDSEEGFDSVINSWLQERGVTYKTDFVDLCASELDSDTYDLNGRALYPDGAPRYAIIACPGTDGGAVLDKLDGLASGLQPSANLREFVANGGCWVGTSAGAELAASGWGNVRQSFLSLGGRFRFRSALMLLPYPCSSWADNAGGVDMYLNIKGLGADHFMMQSSALGTLLDDALGKYRPRAQMCFGGCLRKDIAPGDGSDPAVELLAFNDPSPSEGAAKVEISSHWSSYSYVPPDNPLAGRVAAAFFKPDKGGVVAGAALSQAGVEWPEFQKRLLDYAYARSQEIPIVPKLPLQKGAPVAMSAASAKVGDSQFHYFPVEIPPGARNLAVTLSGLSDNCDLYLALGAYPVPEHFDYRSVNAGTSQEQIKISEPEPGCWMVGVLGSHSTLNGASYTLKADWTETEPDVTPPSVVAFTPADNSDGFPINLPLSMEFDEDVRTGAGFVQVRKVSDGSLFALLNIADADVSGRTATISLHDKLAPETGYYVLVEKGAVRDLAGNSYAGISGTSAWNFMTGKDMNKPPSASGVSLSGTAEVGQTMSAKYVYKDTDGDPEGVSLYQWYRCAGSDGSGEEAIPDSNSMSYIVHSADEGKYLRFGVVPASVSGASPGDEAKSACTAKVVTEAVPPSVISWSLDMDFHRISLRFGENVDASTLHAAEITVQDAPSASHSRRLSGGFTASSDGSTILVGMLAADIRAMEEDPYLAKALANTYLTFTDSMIKDMAGNSVKALPDGSGIKAQSLTPDTTPPENASYSSAVPGDGRLSIGWGAPPDIDFCGVLLLRKESSPVSGGPEDGVSYKPGDAVGDAVVVYNGAGNLFDDSSLANGVTYYYMLFSFDFARNYASGVMLSGTPVATQTVTCYPSADTSLRSDFPARNLGISKMCCNEAYYNLVRFDLTAIPDGATVESAVLKLCRDKAEQMPTSFAVYALSTSGWAEGDNDDTDADGHEPNFNFMDAADAAPWAAGSFSFSDCGEHPLAAACQWVQEAGVSCASFDIGAGVVEAWLAGANNGIMFRHPDSQKYFFFSKETAGSDAQKPRLIVVCSAPVPSLVASSGALDETTLAGATISLVLKNESFADGSLGAKNFTLNNAPPGLSIAAVEYADAAHASLKLAFDGTDFDRDYTNFSITVGGAELVGGRSLSSSSLLITALKDFNVVFGVSGGGSISGKSSQTVLGGRDCSPVSAIPDTGYYFSGWTGGHVGTENPLTLTNVSKDMLVTANFLGDSKYRLTVNGGSGGGMYRAGVAVAISANPPPSGKVFSSWTGETEYLANPSSPETTVLMPDKDIEVSASYQYLEGHLLTVLNGGGTGKYPAGSTPVIYADPAPQGMVFYLWACEPEGIAADPGKPVTTVRMPASDATAAATYKPAEYTLEIIGGTVLESAAASVTCPAGTTVAVAADAPPAGRSFKIWTVSGGAEISDTSAPETSVTVFGDSIITANFANDSGASLIVVSPNGGEIFVRGGKIPVKWSSSGVSGGLRLELLKGGIADSEVACMMVPDTGGFELAVPAGKTPGSDYKVRLYGTGSDGTAFADTGDGSFSITASETVMLSLESYPSSAGLASPENAYVCAAGMPQTVTAVPDQGFLFAGWELVSGVADLADPSSEQTQITPSSDTALRAYFILDADIAKLQIRLDSSKSRADSISISKAVLPYEIAEADISEGAISFLIGNSSLGTAATYDMKKSGSRRAYTFRSNNLPEKITVRIDFEVRRWSLNASKLSMAGGLGSGAGSVRILADMGGKLFGGTVPVDSSVSWKFGSGCTSESIGLSGNPIEPFSVTASSGKSCSYKSGKDAFSVSGGALGGISGDPAGEKASVSVNGRKFDFPSLIKKGTGSYRAESLSGTMKSTLKLEMAKGAWSFRISGADSLYGDFFSSPATDLILRVSGYESGSRLRGSSRTTMTYPLK